MKIVVLDTFTLTPGDIGWEQFEALGTVQLYNDTPDEKRVERIGDAEAILVNRTPVDGETMERCPNLKYIGLFATGYNLIDIGAARQRGITVANVPGYSTMAVAQLTMALLLELTNRAGSFTREVRKGRWTMQAGSCFWDYPLVELYGLTMGLVGFGGIGKAVANMAAAFGMNVLACRKRMDAPPENDNVQYAPLNRLLAESDVVSLHTPLNAETRGMLDSKALAAMKRGAILINTARGGLIDEEAVAGALASGKLAGYGTDGTAVEPVPSTSPLLTSPNCVITPHVGWSPLATRQRLFNEVAENLKAFIQGVARNVVSG